MTYYSNLRNNRTDNLEFPYCGSLVVVGRGATRFIITGCDFNEYFLNLRNGLEGTHYLIIPEFDGKWDSRELLIVQGEVELRNQNARLRARGRMEEKLKVSLQEGFGLTSKGSS